MSNTTEWAVGLDIEGPTLTDPQVNELVDTLGNAVSHAGTRTSTTISVRGADAPTALRVAMRRVLGELDVIASAHHGARVVRADVMTVDEQDVDLARPVIPELVGVSEAAEILGVSRQRASQLLERLDPVARLAGGPVWRGDAVRTFATVERRPGRPTKSMRALMRQETSGIVNR